jgi:hypothetical protein
MSRQPGAGTCSERQETRSFWRLGMTMDGTSPNFAQTVAGPPGTGQGWLARLAATRKAQRRRSGVDHHSTVRFILHLLHPSPPSAVSARPRASVRPLACTLAGLQTTSTDSGRKSSPPNTAWRKRSRKLNLICRNLRHYRSRFAHCLVLFAVSIGAFQSRCVSQPRHVPLMLRMHPVETPDVEQCIIA